MEFSLQSLISVALVVVSLSVVVAQEEKLPEEVAATLKQVRAYGMQVSINREIRRDDRAFWIQFFNDRKKVSENTLRLAARLPHIVSLTLYEPDSQGEGLEAFRDVNSLESFRLSIDHDSPATKSLGAPGWKALGGLAQLKTLDLEVPITIEQFQSVISLTNVESVRFARLPQAVEPVLREWLPRCTKLRSLVIQRSQLTGEFLATMPADCPLQNLEFDQCTLTNEAITSIGRLSQLKKFSVLEVKSATEWDRLGDQKSLETLRIVDGELTEQSIKGIGRLPALKELNLSKSRFVGTHLSEWGKLSKLEALNLSDTFIAAEEFGKLKVLMSAKKIEVNRTKITPEQVQEWGGFQQPIHVRALNTKLSDSFAISFTTDHKNFLLEVGDTFGSLQQRRFANGKRQLSPGEKDLMRLGTKDGK